MKLRGKKATSSSQSGNNQESSGNLPNGGQCSSESSDPSGSKNKVLRKRKADCAGRKEDSATKAASSQAPKHCRRTPHDPDSPPFDWQSTKKNFKDRAAYAFDSKLFCDVTFVVGQGPSTKTISAHKFVLSVGSPVFETMFSGDWSSVSKDIEVTDVEPAVFSALLRYLYTDEASVTADTVMATLYAAKKYAVPSLEDECRDFLIRNLRPENAFTLLAQARLFDELALVKSCLAKIDAHAAEVFASDCFLEIDIETLCNVLERDTLKIRDVVLFEAVCRWSKAVMVRQNITDSQENQCLVLARVLPLIRFPLMTAEEISSTVRPSGLLSAEQLLSLYAYLSLNPKPPIEFNCVPRGCRHSIKIKRFTYLSRDLWKYVGDVDKIGFCCDRDVWIAGFGFYGQKHIPATYSILVRLTDTIVDKVLFQESRVEITNGSRSIYKCIFKESVKLLASTNYTLEVTQKGPKSRYGVKGSKVVPVDLNGSGKLNVTFNSVETTARTTAEQGQFPVLFFRL